jgi:hypothetical protein
MPFHLSKNGTAKAALYILQRLPPCSRSLAASANFSSVWRPLSARPALGEYLKRMLAPASVQRVLADEKLSAPWV